MISNALYTSKTDDWATPQRLFDELNRAFHFTIDVCASKENAKCTKYFTKEQDGLKQDWGGHYMVQSTIWTRNRQMGAKMFRTRRNCSHVDTGKNRHEMVASIHQRQFKCSCLFFERSIEVRKCEKQCPISVSHNNIHELEIRQWQMNKT